MSISRLLSDTIRRRLSDGKALVVLGARQTGKTTLIKDVLAGRGTILRFNGDTQRDHELLTNESIEHLSALTDGADIVFIDEAQRIPRVGLTAKILIDELNKKVVMTGSSALELNQYINESLTGRKWSFELYPITWQEMVADRGQQNSRDQLEAMLLYGSYPAVITADGGDKKELLQDLYSSYLFKDIFALAGIRKPQFLERLLKALSFQVGNEVSMSEVSRTIGLDAKTVETYIQLLEQAFIVFRLGSYKRNLRTELLSKQKIYFWDNGIRNAVIGDFSPMALRPDKGALWENYLISQRVIRSRYLKDGAQHYFWRTTRGQEIDLIEELDGQLTAYEIKYSATKKIRFTKTFKDAYPQAKCIGLAGQEGLEALLKV